MNPLVGWAILLQAAIPVAVVLAVSFGPTRSRAVWGVQVLWAATLILAVAVSGLWLALPWYLPWAMGALLVAAALRGRALVDDRWPRSRRGWSGLALVAALAGLFGGVSAYALLGRRPRPGEAVVMSFPLEGGPFLVAAGGSNALVNPHLATLAPRFRAYRGQSYAVDLVGIGRWGSRRRGLASADPADYAIFGAPVVAPCAGRVVRAFDEVPDMPVPERSRAPIEGNHVILECGRAWIVMAHLQAGSVEVTRGDVVHVGTPIARVGNSGQSDEPHLHIHAQAPGTSDEPLSGEPLPLRFGDRWPVRNQRLYGAVAPALSESGRTASRLKFTSP